MVYYFKNKDTILAEISYVGTAFHINKLLCEPNKYVLYMLESDKNFNNWVSNRGTSGGRKFSAELYKLGDIRTDRDFIDVSLGLSLHDTFWLTRDTSIMWSKVSLFQNSFSKVYTEVARGLHGFQGVVIKTPSPELSISGCSMKYQKRKGNDIYLYKSLGGLLELANSGAYAEYFVTQLEERLGFTNYCAYDLVAYADCICSRAKIFTTEDVGLIDIVNITSNAAYLEEHIQLYHKGFKKDFCDMMVLDTLVFNVDRHDVNIALLFNTNTFEILGLAPFFDFDHSLLWDTSVINRSDNYIMESIKRYYPRTYIEHTFVDQAAYCMYEDLACRLYDLYKSGWVFTNHPLYPLNPERLKGLNRVFRWNLQQILRRCFSEKIV